MRYERAPRFHRVASRGNSVGVHKSAHPLQHTWATELSGTDSRENIDQGAGGALLWLLLAQRGYDRGKPSLQANLSAIVGDSSGGWIEYIYRQEKGIAEIVILRVHQRIV